jgi:light-regulated signal transduction histidine kinase (bacteriophytochrome)
MSNPRGADSAPFYPSDHDDTNSDDTTVDSSPSAQLRGHQIATGNLHSLRNPPTRSPTSPGDTHAGAMSPGSMDRVFPIRSMVTASTSASNQAQAGASRTGALPTPFTPLGGVDHREGYFHGAHPPAETYRGRHASSRQAAHSESESPEEIKPIKPSIPSVRKPGDQKRFQDTLNQLVTDQYETESTGDKSATASTSGTLPDNGEDTNDGYMTARFSHVMTEDGHAVITGRAGEPLQRCEDEPIHVPGAIQNFGMLVALAEEDGKYIVRVVSENSADIIGHTPRELFALDNFLDIFTDEQADNLLDHIDFVRDEETDVEQNGPEVFTMSVRGSRTMPRSIKIWCAMYINSANPDLIICEFELETDIINPLSHPVEDMRTPEDTLRSMPTAQEYEESTQNMSKPLRVLRSARRGKGEAAAMEVFNIMSQIQEQMAGATDLEAFLKILVGVVKELTGFHRVMIYQFDKSFNGRVVTELVDPRTTKDLYKGLNFPASDIPKQARDLYKINRVRILYDRESVTARLVCRTMQDLENPLDLTHSYLRAMSPIHLKYLANMAVRASMSISINAFGELWGLISCHSYGSKGMRVAFPIRKMCRLVGDTASRNIERLSYASRLQARKLINTVPTQRNPSGYIIASSEDLLKLFNADFGLLCINDEAKMLGQIDQIQEALVMLEYLKMRKISTVTACQDIKDDFPDLVYPPGFHYLAGMLLVPLTSTGSDFICFFRRGQLREVKWAGNPYEKSFRQGTSAYLEPRQSFQVWSETVIGKCRDWTEDEIETAAVLCLVYGKFIEVWRQKEAALENSQLTRLLLANSAHEVRTPLNAIINYLEIALEGPLENDTRDYLSKSHSASKSLIYVINDLLDLTKTEQGADLTPNNEMDLPQTLRDATSAYLGDARRKAIEYKISIDPGVPSNVIGDQRKIRMAISNVVANAIRHTSKGSVTVDAYTALKEGSIVHVEVVVQDTGVGMSAKKLDALFLRLEQVQSDPITSEQLEGDDEEQDTSDDDGSLGLGLAVVARIVRNVNGQLRLKSEEGQGSRFVISIPFEVVSSTQKALMDDASSSKDKPPIESDAKTETPSIAATPVATIETTPSRHSSLDTTKDEVLLVDRGPGVTLGATDRMPGSASNSAILSKRPSVESISRSLKSVASGNSAKSDVDRLIDALREPHMVEGKKWSGTDPAMLSASSPGTSRPKPMTRNTYNDGGPGKGSSAQGDSEALSLKLQSELKSPRPKSLGESATLLQRQQNLQQGDLQQYQTEKLIVTDEGMPIRPIRVPSPGGIPIIPGLKPLPRYYPEPESTKVEEAPNADNMNVLVAEDDPVNSKIIKKRLEKLGHKVQLTVNGEECASAYEDNTKQYDCVLMDMQVSSHVSIFENNMLIV